MFPMQSNHKFAHILLHVVVFGVSVVAGTVVVLSMVVVVGSDVVL